MIISLSDAKSLLGISDNSKDTLITEKLKSLEITIRNLTNNKFLDKRKRVYENLVFTANDKKIAGVNFIEKGFKQGDIIEIDESLLNKGIYTIATISNSYITVVEPIQNETILTLIAKIDYPYDIRQGLIKLIDYDFKMSDKIGVKSESISRVSVTYYDMNSTENIEGYPAALMSFLNKYKRIRWS